MSQRIGGLGPLSAGATSSTITLRTPADIAARIAQLTPHEKARVMLLSAAEVGTTPTSGAIVVNGGQLSAASLTKLRGQVDRASAAQGSPLLVAVAQEGGQLNQLRRVPQLAGVQFASAEQMRSMSPEQLRLEGAKVGRALRAVGANVLLGPVLDAASPGSLMSQQARSFGATPAEVLARAQPFIDGLRAENATLLVVAKHFPGHDVVGDAQQAIVDDRAPLNAVRAKAAPFLHAKGLDGVVMSSVRYSSIDGEPACCSQRLVEMVRQANPNALVMTEDVAAPGMLSAVAMAYVGFTNARAARDTARAEQLVAQHPSFAVTAEKPRLEALVRDEIKTNARKAFLAGVDVIQTSDARSASLVAQSLMELVEERPELRARLDASASRILTAGLKAGGFLRSSEPVLMAFAHDSFEST